MGSQRCPGSLSLLLTTHRPGERRVVFPGSRMAVCLLYTSPQTYWASHKYLICHGGSPALATSRRGAAASCFFCQHSLMLVQLGKGGTTTTGQSHRPPFQLEVNNYAHLRCWVLGALFKTCFSKGLQRSSPISVCKLILDGALYRICCNCSTSLEKKKPSATTIRLARQKAAYFSSWLEPKLLFKSNILQAMHTTLV